MPNPFKFQQIVLCLSVKLGRVENSWYSIDFNVYKFGLKYINFVSQGPMLQWSSQGLSKSHAPKIHCLDCDVMTVLLPNDCIIMSYYYIVSIRISNVKTFVKEVFGFDV